MNIEQQVDPIAALSQTIPSSHPSVDVLAAYHDRTLADQEADKVQDHVVKCRQCADLLLELVAFEKEVSPEEMGSDLERRWFNKSVISRTRERHDLAFSKLAALIAVVIGGLWFFEVFRTVSPSDPAIPNLAIVEVTIDSTLRGGTETIDLSNVSTLLGLVVAFEFLEPFDSYQLELWDPEDRLIWRGKGLEPIRPGVLSVALPTRLLDHDEMVLRISGLREAQVTLLAERFLSIEHKENVGK